MKHYHCPHCGQSAFVTVCSDCLAEGIQIRETRSIFHVGRCHRCGHVDDEPCPAKVGVAKSVAQAWRNGGGALKTLTSKAYRLASRAAEAIKSNADRPH